MFQITWVCVAPIPIAASRISSLTERIASSVVRTIVGSISSVSATPPAMGEKRPVASTMTPYAKTPARIDGNPLSSLAQNRTTDAARPSGLTSARYTPANTPTGMLMTAAMSTTRKVPTMALPIPPPRIPAAGGSSVRSARLMRALPRTMSM